MAKQQLNEGAMDLIFTYQFLKRLTTPFKETKAFELGIIDEDGNVLRKSKELTTSEEKNAYGYFDRLVFGLKRLLEKVPGGKTRFASYAAALYLIKESADPKEHYSEEELYEGLMENLNYMEKHSMKKLNELFEEKRIDELSKDTLASYKKKAGADARKADKAGDFKRGNKRFSGIMRATKKEFEKANEEVNEGFFDYKSLAKDVTKKFGKKGKAKDIAKWVKDNSDDDYKFDMGDLSSELKKMGFRVEQIDEAVVVNIVLWNGKKMKKSFRNQSAAEKWVKKMKDDEDVRDYKMHAEEVELDEGKLDKSSPIYKEYEALKKKSVADLRNIVGRSHRVADLKGYDKAGALRQILDDKYGEKKVDAFFGEEVEVNEDAPANVTGTGIVGTGDDPAHWVDKKRKIDFRFKEMKAILSRYQRGKEKRESLKKKSDFKEKLGLK